MDNDTAKEIAAHLASIGRQFRAIKWRLVAPVAAVPLIAGPAISDPCTIPPQRSYGHCVQAKARDLEPSGESAQDVAIAAVGACRSVRQAIETQLEGCIGHSDTEEALVVADHQVHDLAVETVVEIRAARRTRTPRRPT